MTVQLVLKVILRHLASNAQVSQSCWREGCWPERCHANLWWRTTVCWRISVEVIWSESNQLSKSLVTYLTRKDRVILSHRKSFATWYCGICVLRGIDWWNCKRSTEAWILYKIGLFSGIYFQRNLHLFISTFLPTPRQNRVLRWAWLYNYMLRAYGESFNGCW